MLLRSRLEGHAPDAQVVGEETGGELLSSGFAIAIDPVDGTWAFLTGTETYATALAMFRDGEAILGMIGNPTTGEIGYAAKGERTRSVTLSLFGEPDTATTLPAESADTEKLLVNVHPNQSADGLVSSLYSAWNDGLIRAVRSPGRLAELGAYGSGQGQLRVCEPLVEAAT